MSPETTFPIPKEHSFIQAYGQGRVVGILTQDPQGLTQVVVIHLDHPGVSMESEVSPVYNIDVSNLPSPYAIGVTKYNVISVPPVEDLYPN